MTLMEWILLLVVAGICGSIGQALAGYTRGGCIVSIALGFVGALIGRWLSELLGLPELLNVQIGNKPFPLVWSIIGAALFVAFLGVLSSRRRH